MSGKRSKQDRAELKTAFDEHLDRALALAQDMGIQIPHNTPSQFWSLVILERLHERIKTLEALIGSDNLN